MVNYKQKYQNRESRNSRTNSVLKPITDYVGLDGAIGGAIGFTLGGPLGGLVGILVGKNATWEGVKEGTKKYAGVTRDGARSIIDSYIDAKNYEDLNPEARYINQNSSSRTTMPNFSGFEENEPKYKSFINYAKAFTKYATGSAVDVSKEATKRFTRNRNNAQEMARLRGVANKLTLKTNKAITPKDIYNLSQED